MNTSSFWFLLFKWDEIKHRYFLITPHHHVVSLAQISLPLSRHFSLSFIASSRSSGLHPVSSHSCYMYALAGRPAFARPYVGVPMCVCVCVCVCVFFSPVNPKSWLIPSGQFNYSKFEYLNIPGKELNVNDMRAKIPLEKLKSGHFRIINLFPSCYEYWYD